MVKMMDFEIACRLYNYRTDTIDINFFIGFQEKKDVTVVMRLSSSALSILPTQLMLLSKLITVMDHKLQNGPKFYDTIICIYCS